MRALATIVLLLISNVFMTFAWYGHLKFQHLKFFQKTGLAGIVLASWLIDFLEYCFMVPANRLGYNGNGGPLLNCVTPAAGLTYGFDLTVVLTAGKSNHVPGYDAAFHIQIDDSSGFGSPQLPAMGRSRTAPLVSRSCPCCLPSP